jgi:hypothetical protein
MKKKGNTEQAAGSRHELKTEYPLSEKDEQAGCMERMRKLQKEALNVWRALKKKGK